MIDATINFQRALPFKDELSNQNLNGDDKNLNTN
jgi:hypothetical protein